MSSKKRIVVVCSTWTEYILLLSLGFFIYAWMKAIWFDNYTTDYVYIISLKQDTFLKLSLCH